MSDRCEWKEGKHHGKGCPHHGGNIREYQDLNLLFSRHGDSEAKNDYSYAKGEIVGDWGIGLSERLSKPDADMTAYERKLKQKILNAARKSPNDMTLYRSDRTHWLEGKRKGDTAELRLFMNTSMIPFFEPPENEGKTAQWIVVNLRKGDWIFHPNNDDEQEIDVVNKGNGKLNIVDVSEHDDGKKIYEVEVI